MGTSRALRLAAIAVLSSRAVALPMRSRGTSVKSHAGKFGVTSEAALDGSSALPRSEMPAKADAARWGDEHTVMSLATYKTDVTSWPLMFVNTLRATGFQGAIILGVWANTTGAWANYFEQNNVTLKHLQQAPCRPRYEEKVSNNNPIRSVCTEDFPHLKLESSRFLYGRRWLQECSTCTGWALYADFGDINFQRNPFDLLPDWRSVPPETVYLTEEMLPRTDFYNRSRGFSTNHWMVASAVQSCYGSEALIKVLGKPMLNVGSTIGTRAGMLRLLGRMEEEFDANSYKESCEPAHIPDQGLFNYLFYSGGLPYAIPRAYGKWIVNTMGAPCSNTPRLKPDHSLKDYAIIDTAGLLWNEDGTLPAIIHQGKVCHVNFETNIIVRFNGIRDPSIFSAELQRMLANATFPDNTSWMAAASPPEVA